MGKGVKSMKIEKVSHVVQLHMVLKPA